ncbi:MAG: hypothetical protein J5614_05365, partial [Paludibacteraceae bacterium]|nr:hypothetical protein [Paludibacteraceae bacterium]
NGTGMTHSYKQAGSESSIGFTDLVDQKIDIPAGVQSVMVCGWGSDIPVTLKDEVEETTGMDQYLTVEDVDDDGDWHQKGSPYVIHQEMVTKYGWIEKQLNLSDMEDDDELYSYAKTYLESGQFDKMVIEVTALDLTALGVNVDELKMTDLVEVVSSPHGLDTLFPITKMEIPLNSPAEQKYTFGWETDQSISNTASVNNQINDDLLSSISAMPSKVLISAQQQAASLIATATNGYISLMDTNGDGTPDELVISNTADPTLCTHCWIWNVNGLCHATHYPLHTGDTVNVAMTMDGSIVADRITTGVLRSILIQGCNMTAGGLNNQDGQILIKAGDINETYCTMLYNGGIYFGDLTNQGTFNLLSYFKDDGTEYVDAEVDPPRDLGRGVSWTTNVAAINADQIWVSSSHAGEDAESGRDKEFQFPKTSGDNPTMVKLTFRHGILIRYEEIEPEPDPEEEVNQE